MSSHKENKNLKNQNYFNKNWLSEPALKYCLRKDKRRCSVCHKSIELSTSGQFVLIDHGKGKKHLDFVENVKNFFTPCKTKNNQQSASGTLDSPATASSEISSLDSRKKTMESCFTNSTVTKSERI